MKTKYIPSGDYHLTELRTAEGRLMLSEGRSKDESVQGILNMLRDKPFTSRNRHKQRSALSLFAVATQTPAKPLAAS